MDELPINIADAGILVVLLISAIFGFARGFVKEILSITGWIGAVFVTLYLFPILKPFAHQYITIQLIADILTGSLIFIISLVTLSYLTHAISDRVKASSLGALDRSLGIFFGIGRAIILVGIAWLFFVQFIPPDGRPKEILNAKMLPIVQASGEFVAELTPADMRKNLRIAMETGTETGKSLKKEYESIPKVIREDVENKIKDAAENLEKGYDAKSRQQMENLTKGTQVKQ
ncbi:CvpA family protein [Sneathiella sp.]|jgi:membrane protein required for colicin V production|uniref:CvpA family protein n=1 Tax=Sneathiella sp. TaxID=1964365 RepID=UPI0039E230AF